MFDLIKDYQLLLWWLAGASLAIFIASLFFVPAMIVRIPADYFAHEERPPSRWADRSPAFRMMVLVGKNVLGAILMVAGLVMVPLPGQGLLTSLVGFLLIDFPRKYRFEQWLVSRSAVHRPINWLRRRAGRPPLLAFGETVED